MSTDDHGGAMSVESISTVTSPRSSSGSSTQNSLSQPVISRNVSSQSSSSSLTESSSEPNTPQSILRSSPSFILSASSSSSSVTFAPLPELGPRKRNSSLQLGVGARSRMLRNRRIIMQQTALAAEEGEELQPHHLPPDVAAIVQWTTGPPGDPGLAEDAVEDAFLALGRLMKSAGKGLWRRVSLKDKDKDKDKIKDGEGSEGDDASGKQRGGKKNGPECVDQDSQVSEKPYGSESGTPPNVIPRSRRPLLDLSESLPVQTLEEEGRVWEEEISENFRKRLSGVITAPETPEFDSKTTTDSPDTKVPELAVITSTVEATGSQKGKPRSPR